MSATYARRTSMERAASTSALPKALRAFDQWVGWRYERTDSRLAKVPYRLPRLSFRASVSDPDSWSPYALAAGRERVGFVFTRNDPFCGIDLDGCLNPETGEISALAVAVIEHLDSYAEVSPSGRGIKVFVRGDVPGPRRQDPKRGVELYDDRRFFAVTADRLPGAPSEIRGADLRPLYRWLFGDEEDEDAALAKPFHPNRRLSCATPMSDEALLRRAGAAANGPKFRRLWAGETEGYRSHSEADLALCAILAYWCGADPRRIETLVAKSGLCREKWRKRSDYRQRTVERAIRSVHGSRRGD